MSTFRPSSVDVALRESLVSGAARTQTTLVIDPIITKDGTRVAMTDIGDIAWMTLDPGTSQEEIMSFTGITDNTSTYTLTGVVWGYNFHNGTGNVDANKKRHTSGGRAIITNTDHFINEQYVNKDDPAANTGYSPSGALSFTTKGYVDNRNGYWEGTAASFATLPAGVTDGEVRVTLDDSKIYVWDAGTAAWTLAGAGGGAGTVYVETFLGTDAVLADSRTFRLASGSFPADKYLQVYLNGVLMELGASADYTTATSNTAVFNYDVGDLDKVTMLVVSVDLYNPEWNSVNADVIPDLNNTHSIGTTLLRFKDMFLAGLANITGNLTVGGTGAFTGQVTIPETPVADTDAASKGYVDGAIISDSYIQLQASDNLKQSADTARTGYETSLTKKKEIRVFTAGTIRVSFTLDNSNTNNATAYVYINGVVAGTMRQANTPTTFTQDFTILAGDLIQLYVLTANDGTSYYTVSNFRIYYDRIAGNETIVNLD